MLPEQQLEPLASGRLYFVYSPRYLDVKNANPVQACSYLPSNLLKEFAYQKESWKSRKWQVLILNKI